MIGDEPPKVLEKMRRSDVLEDVSEDVAVLELGLFLLTELATWASTRVKLIFSRSCWAL